MTPDYDKILFFLPFDNFTRRGTPSTTEEYVTYREASLDFKERRTRRMTEWLRDDCPATGDDGE
ncbi:MAG: hypothetical protein JWQ56_2933 [Pseudarthrobacter sp.]|nr:hypothetical protein [Pseudarthrobacter sp.]